MNEHGSSFGIINPIHFKQIKVRVDRLVSFPKLRPVSSSPSIVMSFTASQERPTPMVNKKTQPWLRRNPWYINSIARHISQRYAQRSFLFLDNPMSSPLRMGFISFGPGEHTITSCCFLAKILGHGLCSADLAHAARLSKQTTTISQAQQKTSGTMQNWWNISFAIPQLNATNRS